MSGVEPGWTVPESLRGETRPELTEAEEIKSFPLGFLPEG